MPNEVLHYHAAELTEEDPEKLTWLSQPED